MSGLSPAVASWPSFALPQGTTVNGYRIERVLGSGGFGITYLAQDLLQQRFAIKEYFPRQFAIRQGQSVVAASEEDTPLFDECRDRFLREANALVTLSRHAGASGGIVRVQTYFEAQGTCFLVMDYVEGDNLASVLRREPGGLPAGRVRSLLRQLLTSISVVHRAGLLHRDIKPANIILRDDDKVVLIDFGATRETSPSQTSTFTQIYSGGYAPPEQVLGLHQAEFSDLYAIGTVGYRLIGGTLVNALARQNAIAAGLPDPQPPATKVGAGRYPSALLATIDAALAVDPRLRPQNVDSMLAALDPDPVAEEATIVAAPAARRTAAAPSRRGIWSVAAACGALVLAGGGYVVLQGLPHWPGEKPRDMVASVPTQTPAPPPAVSQNTPEAAIPVPPAAPVQPVQPEQPPPTQAEQSQPAQPEQPQQVQAGQWQPAQPEPPQPVLAEPPPPQAEPKQPAQVELPQPARPEQPPPQQPAQPQREAIVLPPLLPVPTPAPTPEVTLSPLDRARAAAASVSCGALRVEPSREGLRLLGFAPAGGDLDRLLAELRNNGPVEDDAVLVDRVICPPIDAVAAAFRRSWDSMPRTIDFHVDQRDVSGGTRLRIDVRTPLPLVYIDLYQRDGTVRHLSRPTAQNLSKTHVEATLALPPGPHLLVAMGTPAPLDLGTRPETEKSADYLRPLQARLEQAPATLAADLAIVTVRQVQPTVMKVQQQPPTTARSARCANIVSRAQLGETLSDAELSALRTECR